MDNYKRELFRVIGELQMRYPEDARGLDEIAEILTENQNNKQEVKKCLNALQRINDKLFNKYGINDNIVDLQLFINYSCNYFNVTLDNQKKVEYNDGVFVQ